MRVGHWLVAAAWLATAACKDKEAPAPSATPPAGSAAAATAGKGVDPGQRCAQLAATCGDDKHIDKLLGECLAAWRPPCAPKFDALFTCYERQLCGKQDRIWAFDDLGVLSDRKAICGEERNAVSACK